MIIDKKAQLIPETTYHIYNRANGSELMFKSDRNYSFFLKKYEQYIIPIVDTFCYCLMPNHFHFLIRVKKEDELKAFFKNKAKADHQGFEKLDGLLSKQFSNFFNSYAKAFNKEHSRMGSLFMQSFKRKKIENEDYLRRLVCYIHLNPIHAKMCRKPEEYNFSSYRSILSGNSHFLSFQEIMAYFGDRENFAFCHQDYAGKS